MAGDTEHVVKKYMIFMIWATLSIKVKETLSISFYFIILL